MSYFSNYGAKNVHIAAPGSDILSTVSNGYAYDNGTSMATPFVTGAAALLLSANENLSPVQIKDYILKNSYKLSSLTGKVATGGLLNAKSAVEAPYPKIKINYQGHVQNIGWQPWVSDGEIAGTFGKSQRIEAIRIKVVPVN